MTKYNNLNVTLSNSQLNKVKVSNKKWNWNNFRYLIGNSSDEVNFPQKLLLTDTQVSRIGIAFENGSSANIKFSKTKLSKMIQSIGVIHGTPIFVNILLSVAKKGTDLAKSLIKDFLDKQVDKLNKEYIKGEGSEITLTNNEMKYNESN